MAWRLPRPRRRLRAPPGRQRPPGACRGRLGRRAAVRGTRCRWRRRSLLAALAALVAAFPPGRAARAAARAVLAAAAGWRWAGLPLPRWRPRSCSCCGWGGALAPGRCGARSCRRSPRLSSFLPLGPLPPAPGQQCPALTPGRKKHHRAQVDSVRVRGARLVHPAPRGSGRLLQDPAASSPRRTSAPRQASVPRQVTAPRAIPESRAVPAIAAQAVLG